MMKPKALIRDNLTLNVNPEGLENEIKQAIKELENKASINQKPINVLVIGGSSGYGLASKIVLKEKANAKIVSISFEKEPKGKRAGSFGYYNNQSFLAHYPDTLELNGDAFSHEMKQEVIDHYKKINQKIDLLVYSIASGIRIDPNTQEKYASSLKPIGEKYSGYNVDIAKETLKLETLEPATQEEIDQTVKVMGGEDYLLWAKALSEQDVLNENVKFVTYTYVGPKLTHAIYKNGTIGQAKRDLEIKNDAIQEILKSLNGKAYISISKAVITKASIFIPTMALYASALFKVMKEKGTHESIVEHKYRLFKDYIFEDSFETTIPLDAFEMDPKTQSEVETILSDLTQENFKERVDFDEFKKAYLKLNGF